MIRKITLKEYGMIFTIGFFASIISIGVFCKMQKNNNYFLSSETVSEYPVEPCKVNQQDAPGQIIHLPFKVTAYCPCKICCGRFADGVTASNYLIQKNDKFVAACPILFDFGDMMDIPGYGIVEVKDRGGKIKGFHIDVFFHTHQEAKNWGIQYLEVGMFLNDF